MARWRSCDSKSFASFLRGERAAGVVSTAEIEEGMRIFYRGDGSLEDAVWIGKEEVVDDIRHYYIAFVPADRSSDVKPKGEYLEAEYNGRHYEYGFDDMEVGDQLRCPIKEHEGSATAQSRAMSAAMNWKNRNLEVRKDIKFTSQARGTYILIERVA